MYLFSCIDSIIYLSLHRHILIRILNYPSFTVRECSVELFTFSNVFCSIVSLFYYGWRRITPSVNTYLLKYVIMCFYRDANNEIISSKATIEKEREQDRDRHREKKEREEGTRRKERARRKNEMVEHTT